ncbi:MAG: T9SS C-terminal target domain-containing protein, partial [Calditrichaeota bacterium]
AHRKQVWQTQKSQATLLSPSGHFLIHYDTTGTDAIPTYDRDADGTPDYLEFVAQSFDRAWQVEIDSLGFAPPPDSTGNPLSTYPVFCRRLGGYGFTFFTDPLPGPPGVFRFTSHIEISTDFSFIPDELYQHIATDSIVRDSMAIAVTAAHEFNHASQLGYQIWPAGGGEYEDLWFIENSATYMEEVVADAVNDYYQYLDHFFGGTTLHLAFNNSLFRLYGEVVFNIMLGELYGKTITREVWEEIVNQPALGALDEVLLGKGSSLEQELQRLSVWMFFCDANALPGRFFPEGAAYPLPAMTSGDPRTLTSQFAAAYQGSLPPLAFAYLRLPLTSATDSVGIVLDAEKGPFTWRIARLAPGVPPDSAYPAGAIWSARLPAQQSDLILSIFSGNWDVASRTNRSDYTVHLRSGGKPFGDKVFAGPNVVRPESEPVVRFFNLPPKARIEIFTGSGTHIATVQPDASQNLATWNLRTHRGDEVASGVYIYRVVSPTRTQSGKILVVR